MPLNETPLMKIFRVRHWSNGVWHIRTRGTESIRGHDPPKLFLFLTNSVAHFY